VHTNFNLNRDWVVNILSVIKMKLPIPKLHCCQLCTQHLKELGQNVSLGVIQVMLERTAGNDLKPAMMIEDPTNQRSILKRLFTSLLV